MQHKDSLATFSLTAHFFFVLEKIETTISDAYKHVLVWIKILMENGYKCYNYKVTVDATKELHAKTEKLYMDRIDNDLTELLCCENCLVKVYNRKGCKNLSRITFDYHPSAQPPNNFII
ncbi:MAG: hypothetical protein IJZ16_12370 [Clostridia bacterium]|nr:hypothetical protein [Clostridia bacterium]